MNLKDNNLEIIIEYKDKNIMNWIGVCDSISPSKIILPYVTKILDSLKGKDLEINFLNLKYMNSSTVRPLVKFIHLLNSNKIKTELIYNSKSNWQNASFLTLKNVTKKLEFITITAK